MNLVKVSALVIYYFLIVTFGTTLLAAAQLRSSGGATFDTWRLNYTANRLSNYSLNEEIRSASEKARDSLNSQNTNESCLGLFGKAGVPQAKLLDSDTTEQIAEARRKHADIKTLDGDVYCIVRGLSSLKDDITYYKNLVQDDLAKISEIRKLLNANNEQYADLVKGRNDFLAFKEMEGVWYFIPAVLVPYDLLVLCLVVVMGALGGVVRLLRDYGAADRPSPIGADYLFVPMVGAVVAVGGYVLAMTGLLLLSSAKSESSLSPFMISLVGIVSGLLAREVIDTLSARGRKILADQSHTSQRPV